MPEQDLQQWLNSLKKGAPSSGPAGGGSGNAGGGLGSGSAFNGFGTGGGQAEALSQPEHHRYASTHPAQQHIQPDPGSPHERPKPLGLVGSIAESIVGAAGVQEAVSYFQQRVEKLRQMQEAMQQAPTQQRQPQPPQAYRDPEPRRDEYVDRDDEALRRKEAVYQQIVSRSQGAGGKSSGKSSRTKAGTQNASGQKTQGGPQSALGLSGNLLHDLRENPAALREAVCLLEILGPPLSERDPFERLV